MIPYREELELRLGPPYRLDGSFASFWAIERILETVRRRREWEAHMGWLAPYVADYVASAYAAMEVPHERAGNTFTCTNIRYRFSVDEHINRVIRGQGSAAMFYGMEWLGGPILEKAFLPYYIFATLAQNQPWAEADHDLIGRRRDHLDRLVPFVVRDSLSGVDLPVGFGRAQAEAVVAACAWPPLGFPMNEKAEFNLKNLDALWAKAPDRGSLQSFLRHLARSQNYFIRLVAARFCAGQSILPQEQNEALSMREASAFFTFTPVQPVQQEVARFLPDDEAYLTGRDETAYASVIEHLAASRLADALAGIDQLLRTDAANAMFLCTRGDILARLGRDQPALADLDRSVALNPHYWQPRINRAVLLARQGAVAASDNDLYEARRIRYGDAHVRNNLLCNFFFTRDA